MTFQARPWFQTPKAGNCRIGLASSFGDQTSSCRAEPWIGRRKRILRTLSPAEKTDAAGLLRDFDQQRGKRRPARIAQLHVMAHGEPLMARNYEY
jgi:hypothetical protein